MKRKTKKIKKIAESLIGGMVIDSLDSKSKKDAPSIRAVVDLKNEFVDGTIPVAKANDATNFDGHTPSYYAKQKDLDNIVDGTTKVAKATNADTAANATKLGNRDASSYLFKSSSDLVDFANCKIGNLQPVVLRNVDVNTYTSSGFYYISDGCSNVPRSYIAVFSSISQGTAGGQVGVSRETNDLYVRNIKSGVFGAWRSIGVNN